MSDNRTVSSINLFGDSCGKVEVVLVEHKVCFYSEYLSHGYAAPSLNNTECNSALLHHHMVHSAYPLPRTELDLSILAGVTSWGDAKVVTDGVEYTGSLPNTPHWYLTDTISIPDTTNFIAVACRDDLSDYAGLVAEIPELGIYSGTMSGWKCVKQDQVEDWWGWGVDTSSWSVQVSKQPIRTRYLGHVTGYQPIRDQYLLI
eukprot:sb/3470627/